MKKEFGNSFWGIVDTAVYPLIYMAAVPILMQNLGTEGFGLWILINSIMVILQLFNLNIGVTTMKELAGLKNLKAIKVLNALLSIVLLMFLLVSLLGLLIAVFVEKYDFSGLSNAPVRSVFECLLLAGIIAGFKFFEQLFHAALKAKELIRQSAFFNIFNKVGLLSITLYLVISGFDITSLLYANLFFSIINLLVLIVAISKYYTGYLPSLRTNKNLINKLFKFSLWPWIQSLFVVIAFQSDRLWVSSYAGLSAVSDYGLIATLFNHIHMIYTAMFIWVLPRFSSITTSGRDAYPYFRRMKSFFSLFVIFGLLAFYFISPWLFPLWIGNEHYENMKDYLQLFVVFELMFSHTIMPFFYMNATGREKEYTYLTIFFSLLCYVFMIVGLNSSNSVYVMLAGMTMSMFISMPILNYYVRKGSIDSRRSTATDLIEMAPFFSAAGLILLPFPWSLFFVLPLAIWLANYLPMFNQLKNDAKIYSFGK